MKRVHFLVSKAAAVGLIEELQLVSNEDATLSLQGREWAGGIPLAAEAKKVPADRTPFPSPELGPLVKLAEVMVFIADMGTWDSLTGA